MSERHQLQTPETLSGIPVAPGAWPVVGHLFKLAKDQPRFLMQTEQDLGPLYWLNQGFGHWTVVVAGEPAHTVMKNKATRSDIMGGKGDNEHITGHTLLIHDGASHKRMRGAMNTPFTPRGLSAAQVGELLAQVAEERVSSWGERRSLTILNETSEFALDIIFQMLGIGNLDLPAWRQKFNEFIGPWIIVPTNLPGSPRWRSKRAAEWMDERFAKLIAEAREKGDAETMLGALAHGTDEEGQGLEPQELLSNLRILALAGHETTAATIAWMFLHLAADPALWEQVAAEATAASGPPTSPKEMADFPLAEALFREVLRLYPVISLLPPRRVEEPFEAHGTLLPKNTRVAASLISLSRDPELYPEPEKLKLERWSTRDRKPKFSEAVQFGGGPHFCLGYHLALLEGVVYTVAAIQALAKAGLVPTLEGDLPKPTFMPLTRPPAKARIVLREL